MELTQIIVDGLVDLSWPVALGLVLYFFRQQVKSVLTALAELPDKITRAEAGSVAIDFGKSAPPEAPPLTTGPGFKNTRSVFWFFGLATIWRGQCCLSLETERGKTLRTLSKRVSST